VARRGEKNGGGRGCERGWGIWREELSTQKEGVAGVLKGRGDQLNAVWCIHILLPQLILINMHSVEASTKIARELAKVHALPIEPAWPHPILPLEYNKTARRGVHTLYI